MDSFLQLVDHSLLPHASATWAMGKKHIFLSETARQQFDRIRDDVMTRAAMRIQCAFRSFRSRRRHTSLRRSLSGSDVSRRTPPALPAKPPPPRRNGFPSSAPAKPPPPLPGEDSLEVTPPPVPPTRPYTVQGGVKISFPQYRVMKQNYRGTSN